MVQGPLIYYLYTNLYPLQTLLTNSTSKFPLCPSPRFLHWISYKYLRFSMSQAELISLPIPPLATILLCKFPKWTNKTTTSLLKLIRSMGMRVYFKTISWFKTFTSYLSRLLLYLERLLHNLACESIIIYQHTSFYWLTYLM